MRRNNAAVLLFLIFSILGALSVSSGQVCSPRYPAVIAGPGGDDPSKDAGIWYSYRQNGILTVNQIVTVTSFGPTIEPLTGLSAYRESTQAAFSTSTQSLACQNQFATSIYIVNGMYTGYQTTSSDNYAVIRRSDVNILYHDYANLLVAYGCAVPKADGTCDTPVMWANTRVIPSQLSAAQMANFDSIINGVFKDYCITVDLLPKQIYDSNQAQCPNRHPPACLGGLITGMKETMPQNSSVPDTNPAATCKWPVYMPPVVNYDPTRDMRLYLYYGNKTNYKCTSQNGYVQLRYKYNENLPRGPVQQACFILHEGVWYVYRQIWSAEGTPVNLQVKWHILGKGVLPLTDKPGSHVWGELPQYNLETDTQCSRGYWTGFLASSGENPGFHYVEAADRQVPLRTTTVYADDDYVFYYGCMTPNLQTGTCKDAFGFFATRFDPAQWSDSQKAHVDNDIIGPLFKASGCSAQNIPILPRVTSKPLCSFLDDAPVCLRSYSAGFSELVKGYMTNPY